MSHTNNEKAFLIEALQWHLDHGGDEAVLNEPLDRTVPPPMPKAADLPAPSKAGPAVTAAKSNVLGFQEALPQSKPAGEVMGTAQAIVQANKLAADSSSLEELSSAIILAFNIKAFTIFSVLVSLVQSTFNELQYSQVHFFSCLGKKLSKP